MAFSSDWHWFTTLVLCLHMGVGTEQTCTLNGIRIAGGHYTLSNGMRTNSRLIYHCPPNYYPHPVSSSQCQPTGTWQPGPNADQKCLKVECPDPRVENGDVYPVMDKYYVGTDIEYECSSGYTLRGTDVRVCQSNGKWNGTTAVCVDENKVSTCADPGVPAGTSKDGTTYDTGNKVTYSCKNGLILVGSRERMCQENGQWTGREPSCYYKHTYDTAEEVSEAFGASIKSSLTDLQPEETQSGRKIRIPKNGTLNIYIAVDISGSISQEEFKSARAAVTKLITKVSSFSVTPNYEMLFFAAEIFEIVNILDFLGAEKPSLNKVREDINKFTYTEGEDDLGTDLNKAFEKIEERMAWIQQNRQDFLDHRHVIIVFTDGLYNDGGSPENTVAKIKHRVYHNKAGRLDEDNRKEYLDIYIFAIGSDISDDDLIPLTAPERSQDKHYFRLKDIGRLEETFGDIIDESEVVGRCGLYIEKKKETANDWAAFKYPWMVDVTNIKSQKCMGSLVSARFVLTAAHCITFEDKPQDIKVYTNDNQVRKVEDFVIHPEFDLEKRQAEGVLEFYDYDVVLLKLKEPITSSYEVRPICIPCTQATSDALKLVGVSTCRQQEERLLSQDTERLAFLTNKNKVKEKDVYAKLSGPLKTNCIEQAKHGYGITDFTKAVTDRMICTGGQQTTTNHIACKGDSGGAVFKEYENRMIQVAVVSWGIYDMCPDNVDMPWSNKTSRDYHINLFKVASFLKKELGNEDQYEFEPMKFLDDVR